MRTYRHVSSLAAVAAAILLPFQSLSAQSDRLSGRIRGAERVVLHGSVHPLAQSQFDLGPAGSNLELNSMMMGLRMTKDQQADLDQLLKDVQDIHSPQYHHWLTPEQYADRFGLSQNDIDKITEWLEGNGFQVESVGRARNMILFSGAAGTVESVLGTPIHRYRVNGKEHFANSAPPSLPKELADLVIGIHGMDDFRPQLPRGRIGHRLGTISDLSAHPRPHQVTDSKGNPFMVPDDLAAIYDLNPIYKAGADGTGISIAVVGWTDLDASDVLAFRKTFGFSTDNLQKVLTTKSNPGTDPESSVEWNMDLEWSGAAAPGAQLLFVFGTSDYYNVYYAIDQQLAPIISSSWGLCEWHMAPADVNLIRQIAQQGAAQGVTWVASSGDAGAAGCEDQNGHWDYAITRMSVNMPAGLPEVTGVGGTEFSEGKGSYYGPSSANGGTALGYIPEVAWNDEALLLQNLADPPVSESGPAGFLASGGGASIYYGKPSWQAGPGVPNDGARDVPDIAFTASPVHDPYLVVTGGNLFPGGGTSASTPFFAGILALLNHYLVGTKTQSQPGLGNINPMLYFLGQNASSVYNDVTSGSNAVPCVPYSTQDCPKNGIYGFLTGPGYDQVTGWGSVDAAKFVATWANVMNKSAKLVITTFTTSSQVPVGGQMNMDVEVANQGLADAGPFQIRVLITTDGSQATAKSWYAYCDMKGAKAGQTVSCSGNVNLDSSIAAGKYFPLAIADYKQEVVQYDRSGNYAYATGKTLTVQ